MLKIEKMSKKLLKFTEFLILQKVGTITGLSYYFELSIKSQQIKYMDKARDLFDWHLSRASENDQILHLLAIIRKYSCNTDSDVALQYTERYIELISTIL